MRVLTIRQPWADLVMSGVKDVENRSWPPPSTLPQWWTCRQDPSYREQSLTRPSIFSCCTPDGPFPFRLGIHAAAKVQWPDLDKPEWAAWDALNLWDNDQPGFGVLLGSVEVTGCHHADDCDKVDGDLVTAWPDSTDRGPRYCSRWAEPKRWHWTLADPQPLDQPVPAKGRLGLWRYQPC
jgi:hypothetical protein